MAVSKCPYNRGIIGQENSIPVISIFFQIIRQILNSHKKYDNNKKTCYNTMYSDN